MNLFLTDQEIIDKMRDLSYRSALSPHDPRWSIDADSDIADLMDELCRRWNIPKITNRLLY